MIVGIQAREIRILINYKIGILETAAGFFGAFKKLRKATFSFVMSVGSHWKNFHEI